MAAAVVTLGSRFRTMLDNLFARELGIGCFAGDKYMC